MIFTHSIRIFNLTFPGSFFFLNKEPSSGTLCFWIVSDEGTRPKNFPLPAASNTQRGDKCLWQRQQKRFVLATGERLESPQPERCCRRHRREHSDPVSSLLKHLQWLQLMSCDSCNVQFVATPLPPKAFSALTIKYTNYVHSVKSVFSCL